MIRDMERLTDKHKVTARLLPSLHARFHRLLNVLQEEGIQFKAGTKSKLTKIGIEAVIGAILVDFMEGSETELLAILRARLAEYQTACLDPGAEVSQQINPIAGKFPEPGRQEVYDTTGKEKPAPRKRGK